jgi:hypothetical protein
MSLRIHIAVIFSLLLCAAASADDTPIVSSDLKFVYLIEAPPTPGFKTGINQTGFRLKGQKGIITALHGVAPASIIADKRYLARNGMGHALNSLVLDSIDVNQDLALLTSTELQAAPDDGIELGDYRALKPEEKVYVLGHPGTGAARF